VANQSDAVVVFTEIDRTSAAVRLSGDLDLRAEPELLLVLSKLQAAAHRVVSVELGELGFIGSTLPNFLVRLRHALAPGATLAVRHPSPLARWILELTDLTVGSGPDTGREGRPGARSHCGLDDLILADGAGMTSGLVDELLGHTGG
jgi:anti-anti-sigma regulatory factor